MSILQPKSKSKIKVISVRVSASLHAELEDIRKRADDLGLALDITTLVTEALQRALKQARSELAVQTEPSTSLPASSVGP